MKEKPQKAPECASEAFCGFGIFRTSAKMRNSAEGGWRLLQQQAVSVLAVDGQVDFRAVVGQQQGLAAVLQQGIDRDTAHRAGVLVPMVWNTMVFTPSSAMASSASKEPVRLAPSCFVV